MCVLLTVTKMFFSKDLGKVINDGRVKLLFIALCNYALNMLLS